MKKIIFYIVCITLGIFAGLVEKEKLLAGTTYCYCPTKASYSNKPSCEAVHGFGSCAGPYATSCARSCPPY